MGLFDKLKNVFTEEVEEEPIKKEVRQVEIPGPKEIEKEEVEEKKEEKFVFPVYFDDKDFEELEPKREEKKEPIKKEVYGIKTKEVKPDKKFRPTPVISPVYGVLDKNYSKDEVVTKKVSRTSYRTSKNISLDEVRKKAFGSLEDEFENSLFKDDPIYVEKEETYVEEINDIAPIEIVEDKIIDDYKNTSISSIEDNMTLDELNKLDDEEKIDMNESDLFNLIDSMYEKNDEESDENGN